MASRRPNPPPRELLEYLAGLGFEELWVARQGPALSPSPVVLEAPSGMSSPAGTSLGPLGALAAEVASCRLCRLAEARNRTVFGSGSPQAALMVIGEGPGEEEDRQGLPFVGRAGELLTRILSAIGRSRESVYIANVVKCRPPRNREPLPDEVAACRGYLEQQIDLVRPRVLLLLGRVAAQALLGTQEPLGRLRGTWFEVRGVPARVTYHPAALLRNPQLKRPTWEDVQIVRDRLQELEGEP